jgi:hypothetical protein
MAAHASHRRPAKETTQGFNLALCEMDSMIGLIGANEPRAHGKGLAKF